MKFQKIILYNRTDSSIRKYADRSASGYIWNLAVSEPEWKNSTFDEGNKYCFGRKLSGMMGIFRLKINMILILARGLRGKFRDLVIKTIQITVIGR